MNILFFLGHPAHYHLFKHPIKRLIKKGHEICIVIKEKDILEKLLINDGISYTNLLPVGNKKRKNNTVSVVYSSISDLVVKDMKLYKFLRNKSIDIMVGTEVSISHIGRILKIPSIITNEDDIQINPEFCYMSYPFASIILSPNLCNVGIWNNKKVSYQGYQKLSYLHPNVFIPDRGILTDLGLKDSKYFLLRFVNLTASHDIWFGHEGITNKLAEQIVELLEPEGQVLITSERRLNNKLEKYRIQINPNQMHNILYFADIFIGDSQSMAVESAVLGTPAIRYNSFAGRISVLEELEHRYGLSFGIKPSEPAKLIQKIVKLLKKPDLSNEWQQRRQKMLADKIDVTAFMVWFIENYPKSVQIMKDNPDYQNRFK